MTYFRPPLPCYMCNIFVTFISIFQKKQANFLRKSRLKYKNKVWNFIKNVTGHFGWPPPSPVCHLVTLSHTLPHPPLKSVTYLLFVWPLYGRTPCRSFTLHTKMWIRNKISSWERRQFKICLNNGFFASLWYNFREEFAIACWISDNALVLILYQKWDLFTFSQNCRLLDSTVKNVLTTVSLFLLTVRINGIIAAEFFYNFYVPI